MNWINIKKILSLLGMAVFISALFNFFDHGSIFPRKPTSNLDFVNCQKLIKEAFIEKAKQNNDTFNKDGLDEYIKEVCDCARYNKKLGFNRAVNYCVNGE